MIRSLWWSLVALLVELAASAALARARPPALAAAALLHLLAAAAAALAAPRRGERRLAIVWVLALPLVGCVAALVMTAAPRGRFLRPRAPRRLGRRFHPGAARQLREQPSLADRLLSPDPDERTAALALLMRRGGADADVAALLRWATTRPEGELALAATVALAHEQPLLAGGTHAGLGDRGGVRAPGRLLPLRRQTAPARGHSCAELDAPCGEASAATG